MTEMHRNNQSINKPNICPRDIYANNRTLAAGIRTSLALFAFGILLMKMDVDYNTGYIFNIYGIVQLFYSNAYYLFQVKNLKNTEHIFQARYLDIQFIISLVMSGILIYLFVIMIL